MQRLDRWNALLEILADRGRLSVTEATDHLGISPATARRDFAQLSSQQLATRTRGGLVATAVAYDLPLRYKSARHTEAKERIALVVGEMIETDQVVCLNGGTTTSAVARAIAARADLATGEPGTITVITNALNIANELVLRPSIKTVTTGGVARPQSYELIGPLATRLLEELSSDVLVLGVNGLHPVAQATAHHEGEAGINALMVQRASRVIAAADGSKLGVRAFARICPLAAIDVLVTDSGADPEQVAALRGAGVDVVLA